MKQISLFLLLASSFAASASTAPLFYMHNSVGGFTPAQYRFSKDCEVRDTKVTIEIKNISGTKITEKDITVDQKWKALVIAAKAAKIEECMSPADGPNVVFTAYDHQDEAASQVVLSGKNEDGQCLINKSKAAEELISIITKLCD